MKYIFEIIMWSHIGHVMKESCGFKDGSLSLKSALCLVWWSWVFCRWRYNIFNLSRDLAWLPYWEGTQINLRPLVNTCLKKYVNLWVETRHSESPSCHIWWSYKIFNKWRELTNHVIGGSSNLMSGSLYGISPHCQV